MGWRALQCRGVHRGLCYVPVMIDQALQLPCGYRVPNRFCKTAMTEGLADAHGFPTSAHQRLYETWARGGAAILISGNIMVDQRYLERAGNVVVEDEKALPELRAWADAVHRAGSQLWGQISHPGRQCPRLIASTPLAPSAVQLNVIANFGKPRAMLPTDIDDVIRRFTTSAKVLQQAGFDGVQIHAAHGYLLSQFLSKRTNLRPDDWGGELVNRSRLLIEVVRGVRAAVGSMFPVSVKINSSDFVQGGFTLDECLEVVGQLSAEGLDLLEVSGGTYEQVEFLKTHEASALRNKTLEREAMFMVYAKAIKARASMPVMVTGGFRTLQGMQTALASGDTDLIGLARPFCLKPDFPKQMMADVLASLPTPEGGLVLGRGHRGPSSASMHWRGLNNQTQAAWYYHQIERLAAGLSPDPALSPLRALLGHFGNDLLRSIARKMA